jgi:hypothetical protein
MAPTGVMGNHGAFVFQRFGAKHIRKQRVPIGAVIKPFGS